MRRDRLAIDVGECERCGREGKVGPNGLCGGCETPTQRRVDRVQRWFR